MLDTKDKEQEQVENDILISLQEDISAWAFRLYEDNESEQSDFELGSIAPLMGIAAKFGELESANTIAGMTKAIGDIFLYVCDYAAREGIVISHIGDLREHQTKNAGLIAVGKMMQSTLHYHRKLIDEDQNRITSLVSINEILAYLHRFTESKVWGIDLITIFRDSWKDIVDNSHIQNSQKKK